MSLAPFSEQGFFVANSAHFFTENADIHNSEFVMRNLELMTGFARAQSYLTDFYGGKIRRGRCPHRPKINTNFRRERCPQRSAKQFGIRNA